MRGLKFNSRSGGFTMMEIMVVIAIMVLLVALAVPAINVLSGSKSIEGATNVVASMIARARSEALSRRVPIGVAVFEDAVRGRTGLALVSYPLPWTPDTTYARGDMVSWESATPSGTKTCYFICWKPHTSVQTSNLSVEERPPAFLASDDCWQPILLVAGESNVPNPSSTPPRLYLTSEYVTLLPETEVMYLPPGVMAQVVNSALAKSGSSPVPCDRYLGSSVVFFDADGKMLVNKRFGVLFDENDSPTGTSQAIQSSRLGMLIQFNLNPKVSTASTNMNPIVSPTGDFLTSGLGIALMDRQQYKAQGFPAWDAQLLQGAGLNYDAKPYAGSEKTAREAEQWIDANASVVLINRYNGSILKTE